MAIAATRPARAGYLVRAYGDMVEDGARLAGVIGLLRQSHPRETVEDWLTMAADGRFAELAEGLMAVHYDPRYDKHRERMAVPLVEIGGGALGEADLAEVAAAVVEAVRRV